MSTLSKLKSAGKSRKVIGRGGDRGGTSGKGHKGQKARSGGKVSSLFEGGQMPLTRRLPKRGFNNTRFKVAYDIISICDLNKEFESGSEVTKEALISKGLLKNKTKAPLKILGTGDLDKKLVVFAEAFSKSAEEKITSKGGEVRKIKEK